MKSPPLRCLALLVLTVGLTPTAPRAIAAAKAPAPAAPQTTDQIHAALVAADDERCAATIAGAGPRLDAIFSDDLYYAHSNGKIDRKASYLKGLVARTSLYRSFDYQKRTFRLVAPGLALMTGHVVIGLGSAAKPGTSDVNFLAVYREENGRWRFLSWQACKNLPPAPPSAR